MTLWERLRFSPQLYRLRHWTGSGTVYCARASPRQRVRFTFSFTLEHMSHSYTTHSNKPGSRDLDPLILSDPEGQGVVQPGYEPTPTPAPLLTVTHICASHPRGARTRHRTQACTPSPFRFKSRADLLVGLHIDHHVVRLGARADHAHVHCLGVKLYDINASRRAILSISSSARRQRVVPSDAGRACARICRLAAVVKAPPRIVPSCVASTVGLARLRHWRLIEHRLGRRIERTRTRACLVR
jgi:hypothetical protein